MEFPDYPYPNNTPPFVTHKQVWNYLDGYANTFKLKQHIKFHRIVEKVVSLKNNKWKIVTRNLAMKKTETETFDAVFVCNNVYSSPHIPHINDAEKFKGKVIHSRDYRRPCDFKGSIEIIEIFIHSVIS